MITGYTDRVLNVKKIYETWYWTKYKFSIEYNKLTKLNHELKCQQNILVYFQKFYKNK